MSGKIMKQMVTYFLTPQPSLLFSFRVRASWLVSRGHLIPDLVYKHQLENNVSTKGGFSCLEIFPSLTAHLLTTTTLIINGQTHRRHFPFLSARSICQQLCCWREHFNSCPLTFTSVLVTSAQNPSPQFGSLYYFFSQLILYFSVIF